MRKKNKGKEKISRKFQELKKGEKVVIIRDVSEAASFPIRLQGRTGVIEDKRGKAYIVKIINGKQENKYIVLPVHLKKIE
ncbi:MAG: 50S ribosomal protein L21e [Nanoarchaeota archaeon]